MTDQELKDLVASLAVQSAKTDALFAANAERDEQRSKEAAKEAAERSKEAAEHSKETAERSKDLDRRFAETDRILKEIGQRMGSMGQNQGDVAEEFFYNSLFDKPTLGGIVFDRVIKNIGAGRPGKQVEFDIVMHNGSAMAIVEVKYKVHPSSLDQIEKQMRRYRELFPEYKDYKLYGGVAGFSVPDDVIEQAHERGLFVLQRKGDVFEADVEAMRPFC